MNREFKIGEKFSERFRADSGLINGFAVFSGDWNPVHTDEVEARSYGYSRPVAHGAILTAIVSRIIGLQVPGPGAIWMNHSIEWIKPVLLGDEVIVTAEIRNISTGSGVFLLDLYAQDTRGDFFMKGSAKVKQSKMITAPSPVPEKKRTALVTGGSRGIGASIARALGNAGMDVAILFRSDESSAKAVAESINTGGSSAMVIRADLSDPASLPEALARVSEGLAFPDTVIHAATPPVPASNIEETDENCFEEYLNVYTLASHRLVRHCLPAMKDAGFGRFVFLGSSYLFSPAAGFSAYIAGKAALQSYIGSAALELGRFGITFNMISPSMAITDLTSEMPLRLKELEAARNPTRRLVSLEEISATAVFLVGMGAGFINGQNIAVTGGPA